MVWFKDLKKDDYLLYDNPDFKIYVIHITSFMRKENRDYVRANEFIDHSAHGGNYIYTDTQWDYGGPREHTKKITAAEVKRYKIKFVFWDAGDLK
jgi:hypothetical protein